MTTRSSSRELAYSGGRPEPEPAPAPAPAPGERAFPPSLAVAPSPSRSPRPRFSRPLGALMAMSGSVSSGSGTVVNQALIAGAVQGGVQVARRLAGEAGHRLELLARRADDSLRRAEVVEQRALAGGADAGQVVEQRRGHRAVAPRAMVRDREAVGLVAHTRQELERGRVVAEDDRRAAAGDEDLLDALGERHDRHAPRAEALERPQAGAELAGAAVDHDQVRQRRERLVALRVVRAQVLLGLPLREPARQHLLHRGEVVGHAVLEAADREAAVVGFLRRAALEDDHRRDRVRAHQVRDVEALDPERQRVQAELLLQRVERLDPLLATALGLELLLLEREFGVALGELEQAALVAAFGGADLDARAAPLAEHLREDPEVLLDLLLDDDLRRDRHLIAVVLEHELEGDLAGSLLDHVLEIERLAIGQHAVAHLEDLRVGVRAGDGDGDDVERPHGLVRDALALEQVAHRAQPVALERRRLVLVLARGLLHPRLEVTLDLAVAPAQERDNAVDRLAVLRLVHVADAGRAAPLDVVVEARRARPPPGLDALARPELEDLLEQVQRPTHALGVRVRAEVQPVAAMALAREVHPREVLVRRDRDERIGLVVPQPDVETRPVLLDEVLLREQRLGLGRDEDELDRLDRVDHLERAAGHRVREVARDPLLDRLRLADVDHLAARIAKQVDPRPVRQSLALLGQT